jgi:hypothetical protein
MTTSLGALILFVRNKQEDDMTGTYMQQRNSAADAAIALFPERWPACFQVYERRRRPLAIGIHRLILDKFDGALTPEELSSALRRYVMVAGAARIDLNGDPAGTVSVEESAAAGPDAIGVARTTSTYTAATSNPGGGEKVPIPGWSRCSSGPFLC